MNGHVNAQLGDDWVHIDLAAPLFVEDRDGGDEHQYPHPCAMKECPECKAPVEPEPTDAERARLFADPDFEWHPPTDRRYLVIGYGLMGGGYGTYAICERCEFFHKVHSRDED